MEETLLKELGDQNDALLSRDFDLVTYLNSKYSDSTCLENVIDEIKQYDCELATIDQEMK